MSWELLISILSIAIAVVSFVIGTKLSIKGKNDLEKAHELTKKYHGFEARQKIDDTVNSIKINLIKKELVEEYWRIFDNAKDKGIENQKITFGYSTPEIQDKVLELENAFNKVCSWYQKEDWVDGHDFEYVIGGYICNTWYLLKDEILYHQKMSDNTNFCKHFQEVADKFESIEHVKKVPLYRMTKSK